MAVDHVLLLGPAEPDPVLDALRDPQQVDMRELGCVAERAVGMPGRQDRAVPGDCHHTPRHSSVSGGADWESLLSIVSGCVTSRSDADGLPSSSERSAISSAGLAGKTVAGSDVARLTPR
jgi:hypothetical protein